MPAYRNKRRTYRKKPYSKSTKTVKKVVKAMISRSIETRMTTGGIDSFIATSGSTGAYLITRYMENGVSDNQFSGSHVVLKELSLRLLVRIPPVSGTQWCSQIRILLIGTDEQITWDANVPADFWYPFSGTAPPDFTRKVNIKNYSVLSDRTHQLTPQDTTTDGYCKQIVFTKRFKKGLGLEFVTTATAGSNNYLKNKNYYLVFVAGGWANLTANINYKGSLTLKYKDN